MEKIKIGFASGLISSIKNLSIAIDESFAGRNQTAIMTYFDYFQQTTHLLKQMGHLLEDIKLVARSILFFPMDDPYIATDGSFI